MRGPPSKCISPSCFFKFIKTGLNTQLSIPISYQKYLVSRRKNKNAILKRGCRKWHVKIDKDWVFGEGWETFVRENGVQEFDFVVFKHEGNMVFDTMVFDASSCEREYPIHKAMTTKTKKACLEEKSFGKCKTDTDVLKKTPKVKDTYINKSTKPFKSEKTMISDHSNHPYFIGTLKAPTSKLYLPFSFTKSNGLRAGEMILRNGQTQLSWIVDLKIYSGNYYCIGRGWPAFYIENGLKQGDRFKLEFEQTEIDSMANFYPIDIEKKPAESHEAVETEGLNCHRHFVGTLKHYDMSRKYLLIPKAFALANGLSSGDMILKYAEKEGTWTVKMNELRKSYYIRRGLHHYCITNGLENGDIIKFELIQNGEKPVAVISRLPEESRKKKENRCFKSIATAYSIKKSAVYVPLDFARSNGFVYMNNSEMVVMDEKKRLWPTKVCPTHDRVRIKGFKDILAANGLKAGDEFVLELVDNGKKPLMNLKCMKKAPLK